MGQSSWGLFFNFQKISLSARTLTDRQRALLLSYAEDEADVEGTVNGVTATTTGSHLSYLLKSYFRPEMSRNVF